MANNKKPLLSIIIPHKDSKQTLVRLLRSICCESDEVEIIVVDDGSTREQNPAALAQEYDQLIVRMNSGPEFNAGQARNIGLECSSGEWFLFADADDVFLEGGVETVLKEIRECSEQTDIIFFGVTSWNAGFSKMGKRHEGISRKLNEYRENGNEETLRYEWPQPIAKATRGKMVRDNSIRFDSITASNDVMFSFLCGFYAQRIKAVSNVIYCIYESPLSLSGKLTPSRALARLDTLIRKNSMMIDLGINGRLDRGYSWFFSSLRAVKPLPQLSVYGRFISYTTRRVLLRLFS